MGDACKKYKVDLHAYVLMKNHVYLLMTPNREDGICNASGWRPVQR